MSGVPSDQPLVTVDAADPTPPFEQVRRQLAALVADGSLPAGHRLPPVRQLAGDLALAAGTVARAYRELEAVGLVTTRRGAGTRVADRPGPGDRAAATAPGGRPADALAGDAAALVARARRLGVSDAGVVEVVRAALTAAASAGGSGSPTPPARASAAGAPAPRR